MVLSSACGVRLGESCRLIWVVLGFCRDVLLERLNSKFTDIGSGDVITFNSIAAN